LWSFVANFALCGEMKIKYVQIILLASVFALQFLAEHRYPQKRELNSWKNERFNLAIGLLNVLIMFLPAGLLVQLIGMIEKNQLGLLHQFTFSFYIETGLTIIVMDFWMYVWHRLNHQTPFLWRFHKFHHKDTRMNSTTALRFHTAELFLAYPGKAIVCFIFGISYLPLIIYETLFFTAVVIHHSNTRITSRQDAIYRLLFASPLMHRIHHSIRFEETNSNFGAVFSFWDRLLGSSTESAKSKVVFGLPEKFTDDDKSIAAGKI
jgi:sterol desaturase/sphingolipid hydroxylase (fatty acid hydroxylase superfamily)